MDVAESIRMEIIDESLPPEFENEIVENEDKVVIRSNLKTMVDINEWVKEFGIRTNTKWNTRKSCPSGEKFVCWKKFECHHSSFNKVSVMKNTKTLSKNAACQAFVSIKIKLNTMRTRMTDSFIRRGLVGVITIAPFHTHSLMTAETLRFLPAENCREEFEAYFNAGMGPAEASKYHRQLLQRIPAFNPNDLDNSRINPTRRTVAYWHDKWRLRYPGTGNGSDVTESSGTSSREEEKKSDHIPLEPTIEIKEEPIDYNPTPSTSTDTANEEFILPHEENTWTPPVHVPPPPVVEPQFTLSVASLASSKEPEAFDVEQARKKRKAKTSTFVPSTNGPEVRSLSPVYSFGEVSSPGSLKEPRKDQFDVFGEYIAAKLRSLDRKSCAYAQRAIGDIIFEAEMGKYLNEGSESQGSKNCAS